MAAFFYLATSLTTAQKARKPFRPYSCQFGYYLPFIHYLIKNKVKSILLYRGALQVLQSVKSERQCVYVVVQNPSLVVCASHECLGLFLRADIESLIVDTIEAAFDHCISLLLCLKNTLV